MVITVTDVENKKVTVPIQKILPDRLVGADQEHRIEIMLSGGDIEINITALRAAR